MRSLSNILTVLSIFFFSAVCHANIEYRQLGKNTWLYTARMHLNNGSTVPYNGVIALSTRKAIVIDAPATNDHMNQIADWIVAKGKKFAYVVPQHSHEDSTGGLSAAVSRGAKVIMLSKTDALLKAKGINIPARLFESRYRIAMDQLYIELGHFGAGHSPDSVVAWIGFDSVLVGGCLIKSLKAKDLGNTEDAVLAKYPQTLMDLKEYYSVAKIVTPGHGEPGGLELIDHTLSLLGGQLINPDASAAN